MTLSSPSALAASISLSIPPKSAADLASATLTPVSVLPPAASLSGGAHAARPTATSVDAARAADAVTIRDVIITKPFVGHQARAPAPYREPAERERHRRDLGFSASRPTVDDGDPG